MSHYVSMNLSINLRKNFTTAKIHVKETFNNILELKF